MNVNDGFIASWFDGLWFMEADNDELHYEGLMCVFKAADLC